MPGKKRSYVILRDDGLLLHTKPITREEAEWLWYGAYKDVEDRAVRIRYLEEYGNVMDVEGYLKQMDEAATLGLYIRTARVYEDPSNFAEEVAKLLGRGSLPPGARQVLKELLGAAVEFLRRPARPQRIVAPVRYLEAPKHLIFGPDGAVREARPRPMWYAYKEIPGMYGISAFEDSFWLWRQEMWSTRAVAVRRDVADKEVVAALARDGLALGLLRRTAEYLMQVVRERETELIERGYGDVARKAKIVLAAAELLNAGRREEEGVPA